MGGFYYNTNGFAFHRLDDAVRVLAALGYDGVAWTPDVHHLDPLSASSSDIAAFRSLLGELGLEVILETGARFLLDPRRKHHPSLLCGAADARRRLDFLLRCVEVARDLGASCVSTWAGVRPAGVTAEEAFDRLVAGLKEICLTAERLGVRLGFEPEPGMAVETAAEWVTVRDAVDHPALGLTLDVGHCIATREGDPAEILRTHREDVVVLQLDDHRPGVHEHLGFGEGVVDFAGLARAVAETGFEGPLEVELSAHSSSAPQTAAAALGFLQGVFR